MWFLTRFVGVVFVLNAMLMGGLVTYRAITPTRLDTLLAIEDGCGIECWFGFRADAQTHRRDIETAINVAGGKTINTRGTNMRFSHYEADQPNPIGTIAVELSDGYAVTMCFFPNPNTLTIGEVFATFGPPDSFWLYWFQSRAAYEMSYEKDGIEILVQGAADFNWFATQRLPRLGDDVAVGQICTASDIIANQDVRPEEWPIWRGFNARISNYWADVYVSDPDAPFSIQ